MAIASASLKPDLSYIFIWFIFGLPVLLQVLIFINLKVLYAPSNFNDEGKYMNKKLKQLLNSTNTIKWVLFISLSFVVLSFLAPFILTYSLPVSWFDLSRTGDVGSAIGGTMTPFIALAAMLMAALAFLVQYQANELQKKQVRFQQFESQFYEMLRLHRENVLEMKIEGYDFRHTKLNTYKKFDKTTEKRKVFVTMQAEFESILTINNGLHQLNQEKYNDCYSVFMGGLDRFVDDKKNSFCEHLKNARKQHGYKRDLLTLDSFEIQKRKKYSFNNIEAKLYFNYKPFSGHSSRLGHYFRHLFSIVKMVAESVVIKDYEEKMKYLKILRMQLSNHEQVMLFYNWLSEYGGNWENDKNKYFTKYLMIHNLDHENLFDTQFIKEKISELKNNKDPIIKGNLFEIDGYEKK